MIRTSRLLIALSAGLLLAGLFAVVTISAKSLTVFSATSTPSVTFTQTGLDISASGTVLVVNGTAKAFSSLPFTIVLNSGDSLAFSYADSLQSSSGKQFKLVSANASSPLTAASSVTV